MSKNLHLTLMLSLLFISRAAIDLNQWELFTDDTTELSIRGLRMGRLLASNEDFRGFPLRYFNRTTRSWVYDVSDASGFGLSGTKLKIGSTHEWHCNKATRMWIRQLCEEDEPLWVGPQEYFTKEFELSTFDHIWFIGDATSQTSGASYVYRRDQATNTNTFMNQEAAKLAVEPSGNAWIIKETGEILRYDGSTWIAQPGTASQIAIGSDSIPIIVSQEGETADGFTIKKWNPHVAGSWETIPGIKGTFVTLDSLNNLYVVTKEHKVYRQRGFWSAFCPMCRATTECPECEDYEGHCTQTGECINCPPATVTAMSPLRCEPCPEGCQECSSSTTCTTCAENHFLTPNGTCLPSCDAPLKDYTSIDGKEMCGGPCIQENTDIFYYPSDGSCRSTCEVPLHTPGALYQSCDPCPDNCQSCSSTTNCLQCHQDFFLSPLGACLSSCEHPLKSYTEDGIDRCKGPCADDTSNTFYYPGNDTCQATCGVPIPSPEGFYDSCEPCPSDCLTCSNTTTCERCISTSYLSPNATCLSSCDAPMVSSPDEAGNLHCVGPCADTYYYPHNDTCQESCGVPIPGGFYRSCEPCPNNCHTCSSTTTCLQCFSPNFLTPLGTCESSCPHPLAGFEATPGNWRCEGPCAAETTGIHYYPGDDSCRPTCKVPVSTCFDPDL